MPFDCFWYFSEAPLNLRLLHAKLQGWNIQRALNLRVGHVDVPLIMLLNGG